MNIYLLYFCLFISFGFICHFQHCTGHIITGNFVGRGNQKIQLVNVLYCKLLTNSKQLPTFPQGAQGFEPLTSEVEGECVTTVSLWPYIDCIFKFKMLFKPKSHISVRLYLYVFNFH